MAPKSSELEQSIPQPASKMSTLADELLNDFEDSGSDGEGEQQNGFLQDSASPPPSGLANGHKNANGELLVADDAEDDEDDDEDMLGATGVGDAEDEEETKAKVEKMQLGNVSDVRNVAGLKKTLDPVLEVCFSHSPFMKSLVKLKVYILCEHSPDVPSAPENCPLPGPSARETDNLCRLGRGQSRVPPPHAIQYLFDVN